MHHREKHEAAGGEKMEGPRRLPPAKHFGQPWPCRIYAGRHGKTGAHHQRKKADNNQKIARLLQDIIAFRLVALGKTEARVFAHFMPDMGRGELIPIRRQIAIEVATRDTLKDTQLAAQQMVQRDHAAAFGEQWQKQPGPAQMGRPCIGIDENLDDHRHAQQA